MPVNARLAISFVLISLIVTGSAATTLADDAGATGSQAVHSSPLVAVQETPETDATETRIAVAANGSAVWSLTFRMRLETEADEDEFGAFQDEFAANRSAYLSRFQRRMARVVDDAEIVTNREMNISNLTAETGIEEFPRRAGYVTYRFHWNGFASVENGEIHVGDVFEGGFRLGDSDVLVIEPPAGYERTGVDPMPDDPDKLEWSGPESFADARPQVNFSQPAPPDNISLNDTDQNGPDNNASNTTGDDGGFGSMGLMLASSVVVLVGAGALYARWRRDQQGDTAGGPSASTRDSSASETAAATASGGEESDDDTGEDLSEVLDFDTLATDEDRVVALLEHENGRIRQSKVADALDWSPSKTSRVLSEMAESGRIEKLRIGRENVISIDESEPDGDEP